ncbi:hypothetical protein QCA50_014435 [Cerrena zonata]|uniref:Uncharacterized protein n=1 Tax=Cerrena zonata TaxID=2478898 RepID=A0AAW0FMT3_9APHY
MGNPNFPPNLDIKPSSSSDDTQTTFGTCAQVDSIRTYGIAGRVWEAAYVMQRYISNDDQYIFEPTFLGSDNWTDNLRILELGSGTGIIAAEFARLLSGTEWCRNRDGSP